MSLTWENSYYSEIRKGFGMPVTDPASACSGRLSPRLCIVAPGSEATLEPIAKCS